MAAEKDEYMEHLNESFLGVFEHLTEAIRKLGLHAMGVDEDAVRHEALDQLAMGLQCLKTGEAQIRAEYIRIPDVQAKTAFPATPEHVGTTDIQPKTAASFARFEARKDPKRSLIGPGEILIEESFLQTALEAVEAVLEMAPHVRQEGDGGPSLEDEATRAFSALRAALRCGARSIEAVDLDTSDNEEAAQ
jgi:hypothetical protein